MGFLSDYAALQSPLEQLALMEKWIVENPAGMFAELRAQKPIFITPGPVIVSRYRDVIEVASLDQVFSVKPYGVAMMRDNGGPNFVLGMDDGPEFESDLAILHLAVKRSDMALIRGIVANHATKAASAAASSGSLDITQNYARLVPSQFVAEYFGVPGPDLDTLMGWVRVMFTDIFLNFTSDPKISAAGIAAGVQFRAYVDQLIESIQKSGSPKDDVIGRLIRMQADPGASLTNSRLRDNLIGCVTGVLENTNTAIVTIIDFLLDHPDQMQGATTAAKAGDDDLLLKYVQEILRFHTPAPILVRLSLAEHTLSRGTPFETTIPAGKLIFASNGSAMMDESEVEQPLEFRTNRPAHHYLHFGWGTHQCLGKYISQVQLVEMVKPILKLAGLRRAEGASGHLSYQGPFPASFVVEFDKASEARTVNAS
jgi:cytochrome P450